MQSVSVPQQDGEISMCRGGADPVVYQVSEGTVQVEDADVDLFLRGVPNSTLSGGNQSSKPEQKEA